VVLNFTGAGVGDEALAAVLDALRAVPHQWCELTEDAPRMAMMARDARLMVDAYKKMGLRN